MRNQPTYRIIDTNNCDGSLLKRYVEAKCNHSPFLLHTESYIPVSNDYIILSAKAFSLDVTYIDNLITIQIEKPSLIQGHSCKLMSNNLELYHIYEFFCVKTQIQATPTFVTYQPKIPKEEPLNIKKPNVCKDKPLKIKNRCIQL